MLHVFTRVQKVLYRKGTAIIKTQESVFYIHGSVHRNYVNKIQQDATFLRGLIRPRWRKVVTPYYDLYQRLQLQFYVLLMMGALDT
jgi:hypothetical protein